MYQDRVGKAQILLLQAAELGAEPPALTPGVPCTRRALSLCPKRSRVPSLLLLRALWHASGVYITLSRKESKSCISGKKLKTTLWREDIRMGAVWWSQARWTKLQVVNNEHRKVDPFAQGLREREGAGRIPPSETLLPARSDLLFFSSIREVVPLRRGGEGKAQEALCSPEVCTMR